MVESKYMQDVTLANQLANMMMYNLPGVHRDVWDVCEDPHPGHALASPVATELEYFGTTCLKHGCILTLAHTNPELFGATWAPENF